MKIKSLLIMPNKEVQLVKIPANIKFIKSLIGEKLVKIQLDENTIIIANKNASCIDFNRILAGKIINGTFLIVATKKKRRVSLKRKQIRKYKNMFKISRHQKKIALYKQKVASEINDSIENVKIKMINFNKEDTKKVA